MIYFTYGDLKVKTNNMTCIFFNREGEVQLILSKTQKYLHVLLVL